MAKAVQRLGHLSHPDWVGDEPNWASHDRAPDLREPASAFQDDLPVEAIHEKYAATVQSILSPAAFRAHVLYQQIHAHGEAGRRIDPLLQDQLSAAMLRAELGEDREDSVTREHWTHVWWECATISSEIEGAQLRLPGVASHLLVLTQSSRLKTYARSIAGGASAAIPPEAWEVTSGLPRLASCALNLAAAPRDADEPPTHWIFVDEADLDREMHDIEEEWARNRVEDNAPIRRLTEGTQTDCATWLALQFEDSSTRQDTKADLFEKAKKVFRSRLSERGFLEVWSAVSVDYPDRRRSGPRNKKANSSR